MKTIILSTAVYTIFSTTRIIGRNPREREASKVRLSLSGDPVIPFYVSRTLSEINLISERRVGDALAASIPSDNVTERQSRGLSRLKLSIIDTGFNYLIVSPEHACVSYLKKAATVSCLY